MRVAFDLDGVLVPWHEAVYDYAVRFEHEELDFKNFWIEFDRHYNEIHIYNTLHNPLFVESSILDFAIVDMINRIAEKHQVYYITSRPKGLERVTIKWLKRNRLPSIDNLYITYYKELPISLFKIDLMIEDRPSNYRKLSPYTRVLLVPKPWHTGTEELEKLENLLDLEKIIGD